MVGTTTPLALEHPPYRSLCQKGVMPACLGGTVPSGENEEEELEKAVCPVYSVLFKQM